MNLEHKKTKELITKINEIAKLGWGVYHQLVPHGWQYEGFAEKWIHEDDDTKWWHSDEFVIVMIGREIEFIEQCAYRCSYWLALYAYGYLPDDRQHREILSRIGNPDPGVLFDATLECLKKDRKTDG